MKFEFYNPTRLVFGAGVLARLGDVVRADGTRALLVTGGGSVKRSGVFGRAVASLEAAGVSSVVRGAQLARGEGCDVVVGLGGGSTMDAAKVMAAAVFHDGDPWDMIFHGQAQPQLPTRALPVVTVPTLAATGSEMNSGAVITDEKTTVKSFVIADCLFPRTALVDPELTLSVPPDQTAFGVCDLITHVTEGYFNGVDGTPLQDRFAEGVVLDALEWGPKAVANGGDLEARAQVQWASVVALNGWVQAGTAAAYPVHMIEHVLSAPRRLSEHPPASRFPGLRARPATARQCRSQHAAGDDHANARRAGVVQHVPSLPDAGVGALLMGPDGEFITGSDFLMDGGVTAGYWHGALAPR